MLNRLARAEQVHFSIPDTVSIAWNDSSTIRLLVEQLPQETTGEVVGRTLPLVIAFLAVLVGPAIQLFIARRAAADQKESLQKNLDAQIAMTDKQLRASFISSSRQLWIENLRGDLAEFAAIVTGIMADYRRGDADAAEFTGKVEVLQRLSTRIKLTINPGEPQHRDLVSQTSDCLKILGDYDDGGTLVVLQTQLDTVVSTAQAILKTEWDRSKKFE